MRKFCYLGLVLLLVPWLREPARGGADDNSPKPAFHTSDRCLACHNGLTTPDGKDVSIGYAWRASIMANSSRDPYWQASVRRETLDHSEVSTQVQDECSVCHMPITRYEAKARGKEGEVFAFLPFSQHSDRESAQAEDGVTCSVCHQISSQNLGAKESFTGGFVVEQPASKDHHPEFGPYLIEPGQALVMQSSTGGFRPTHGLHVTDSALCGTCHTLYTTARGEGGKDLGTFPSRCRFWNGCTATMPASRVASRATCLKCTGLRQLPLCWGSIGSAWRSIISAAEISSCSAC